MAPAPNRLDENPRRGEEVKGANLTAGWEMKGNSRGMAVILGERFGAKVPEVFTASCKLAPENLL